MNYPRVSIIILNWNGWKDTIECLESLYRINYPNYDVIVVDNNSQNESIEKIKEYCNGNIEQILPEFVALRSAPIEVNSKFFKYSNENKPIRVFELSENEARNNKFLDKEKYETLEPNKRMILIKNKDNYGFAGGNNVGIKFALDVLNPDYILLLNNDTVVDKNFLIEMVKVAECDEKIGIVGSKIYYYDYKGRDDVIWGLGGGGVDLKTGRVWHYYFKKIDDKTYKDIIECGYITGCSMLVKNNVLKILNGFDENYFCYYEDTDLSIRCKNLGYKLVCATKSVLWHKVSVSSGGDSSPITAYLTARNCLYFIKKNNKKWMYCSLIYLLTYKHARRFVNFVFLQKKPYLLKYYYKGILDGIKGKGGKGI
ncbi:glycosyltransferase family 2 protein [Methanothermococcus okinawensis]|uniref:Glycosyl transferase family 2 n=1 Tax=Methanothermococcus okinawensis (strain DSM 14208 / JCM 11175 / IH1) TaxID=647113 RepID=F8AJS4_METOI|nr:glycosyltransferase family 2 protein [Methanothermococcus okinawensis]AEH07272.1 glycosyl transferase family 2 [Methanothermococcus okinawensis IH1]